MQRWRTRASNSRRRRSNEKQMIMTSLKMQMGIAVLIPACCCVVLGTTCSQPAPSSQLTVLKKTQLTSTEIKYGRGVKHDSSVVYQPGVIIVENGPEMIRSAGADGFTWTLDARAGRDLTVGKIAFVTGRCVGRILALQREGDSLRLVLGPVELTEIFKKLDVTVNQGVDSSEGLPYAPPQLPGVTLPLTDSDASSSDWATAPQMLSPRDSGPRFLSAAYQLPPVFRLSTQAQTPLNNADGVGMEFRGEKYGLRAVVQAQVRLQKPSLEFHLSLNNGVVNSKLILHNAAGLKIAFDSAVDEGGPRNITWFSPAGSLSFPISGPVPLAFDVRQELYLDTQFASGTSSFSAGGNYDFNADIGLTYQSGKFDVVGPKGVTARKDMIEHISGVSLAPRRFAFRHALIITAGVGGAGFTAGPRLVVGTRLEVKHGGNLGIIQCQDVVLSMGVKGGVGWTVPRLLTQFVNAFLSLVRAQQISDHGGITTDWKILFTQKEQVASGTTGTDTHSQICGST